MVDGVGEPEMISFSHKIDREMDRSFLKLVFVLLSATRLSLLVVA